jgi:glycosyltransferase involved in cell wall biosynthesis
MEISMNALFLWGIRYKTLSDVNRFFDKRFYRTEEQVYDNIDALIDFINLNNIKCVFIQNPYLNEKRLTIYKTLKEKGINLLISDRGALPNSWFFDPNGFNADSSSYNSKYWDKPLSKEREENVLKYINNEVNSDIALELQGKRFGAEALKSKLKISKNKKVLFVPLQRPSDTVIKYFSGNVKDMEHFLRNIVEIQDKLKDDWVIVVKKHPLETERIFEDKLLYVEDDTHFKDLIEMCDTVMLINSGVGVISMMYQKPVLHFGKAFYSHPSINKEVKDVDDAIKQLNNLFQVDFEKVKRFISYLIEDFYSFGEFTTELITKDDGSKITATRKIDFYKINNIPRKSKKDTLIVTDVEFWRADLGSRQRVFRMIKFLNKFLNIKILFLKEYTKHDIELITKNEFNHLIDNIHDISVSINEIKNTKETITNNLEVFYNHEFKCKFNKYLEKYHFDNIMIEYIKLDYLLNDLHGRYTTIIDTHDLMSMRTKVYKENNDRTSIVLEKIENEIKILSEYRYVLSIQKNEYNLLNEYISKEKNLLIPHAVDIVDVKIIKNIATNIIFISGPANYKHIIWFIENIWKYFLNEENITLNIYGSVCNQLKQYKGIKNIQLKGYVDNLTITYANADIVVNPVLYGSGLKIKNVEALANGVPLITTDEGANGIEDGINYAFLLANSVDEWIEAILALKLSKELREKLSKNAIEYSKHYFSDKNCYQKLVDVLKD